jgi:glycosyltransferase involved in cell wall biosynthesis
MKSEVLVSVLMPAFNAAAFIDLSIESVVNQSYSNWELIIVDDGSTDSTYKKIDSWRQSDERVRVYVNDKNEGLGFATNRALKNAKGVFIAKLDSDDIASPDWIETRIEHLLNDPKLIAVTGSRVFIDNNNNRVKAVYEKYEPVTVCWKLIFGNPVVHPGIVFRAQTLSEYKNIRYLEDWELWSRLILQGGIRVVNDYRIQYRIHSGNTSSKLGSNKAELLPVIKEIVTRQTCSYFNMTLDEETIWYLYRDRNPFIGEANKILTSLQILENLFQKFVDYRGIETLSKDEYLQLKISFWDQVIHVVRLGKIRPHVLIKIYKNIPLNLFELLKNPYNRKVGSKLVYTVIKLLS